MNFDLHSHSTASDGMLSPTDVATRAADNGVELWALTDHDLVLGLDEARAVAADRKLPFIDGIEISITWRAQTIHIVGLAIDPNDATLVGGVNAARSDRQNRAARIADQLEAHGVKDALAGAYRYAEDPLTIGRAHFARYMVEAGYASDTGEVFDRYLSPGRPGYVEHTWSTLAQAVGWIRGAGGLAVIAHPGRYRLSREALRQFVGEFKSAGGHGIEVITSAHSDSQAIDFGYMAREFGLLASRGSDFHGPEESKYDLGRLPALDPALPSILDPLVALAQ